MWEGTIEQSRAVHSRIRMGQGIINSAFENVEAPVALMVDPHVAYVGDRVEASLNKAARVVRLNVPMAEAVKSLDTVQTLYRALGDHGVTRDTVLVVVGGGVMTDLCGFVAATYLRGLSWIAVPTTLLAQVDAAIGGKVGVNMPWGKNLVGAFHLPTMVVADVDCLQSLPVRQWQAGLGEVMKSALIAGGDLWRKLTTTPPRMDDPTASWLSVIQQTAAIKINVVNQDLTESNVRFFLNFGHTVGHALEHHFGYGQLTHGEAVGLGTLVALALSERHLGLDKAVRTEVEQWLDLWGLPRSISPISLEDIRPALMQDKKARASGLQWVLIGQVGQPQLVTDLSWTDVENALSVIFRA